MVEDTPEFIIDSKRSSSREAALVIDIVLAIGDVLSRANLSESQVAELKSDIAFGVCAVLDAAHEMVVENDDDEDEMELPLIPCMSFFLDEDRKQLLVNPEGTALHEHVSWAIDDETVDDIE